MPQIYDKPVRLLLKDMVRDMKVVKDTVFTKKQARSWFGGKYPKIKDGTISAHLIKMSTNAHSRIHYNAKPNVDDLLYQIDGSHFRLYEPGKDPQPIYTTPDQSPEVLEDEENKNAREFAYEEDLKNFLAKNLTIIEPDLHLYKDEEDEINGIEFPVGGRFVDILALDKRNNYVIIELKVSRGYDRVVGQLLRYISWIRKNQADTGQEVRGVIVARKISEDIKLACSGLNDITLFEYELSVSLISVEKD